MKILFVGPTLFDLACSGRTLAGTDVLCRPPAQQGDIARAVLDGATAIGLVDGRYEDVAAPWHKEILFALSRGVAVLGAASMGALRAAECAAFGMVPVGEVAARYLSGELTDDAAVAQIHAPPELGCTPLTEALVNVEATIVRARSRGAVSADEARQLRAAARRVFFKDRTYPAVVRAAGFSGAETDDLESRLTACRRDVKRADALALVEALQAARGPPEPRDWIFHETTAWRHFIQSIETMTDSTPAEIMPVPSSRPGKGRAPRPTEADALAYIAGMTRELAAIAKRRQMRVLERLLSLAAEEARGPAAEKAEGPSAPRGTVDPTTAEGVFRVHPDHHSARSAAPRRGSGR